MPAARAGEVIAKAGQTLEAALERIKPAASAIIATISSLPEAPDEVAVEFGLKVTGKAEMIVASAGVEANYKITLTWKKT